MGRPLKDIQFDASQVEKLAAIGVTNREMGELFGMDESTVAKRFAREIERGRGKMKTRLRQRQMKAAMAGSIPMLIWLGKQVLGQADKQETKNESSVTITEGGIDTSPKQD